jgi:hypothetical protein
MALDTRATLQIPSQTLSQHLFIGSHSQVNTRSITRERLQECNRSDSLKSKMPLKEKTPFYRGFALTVSVARSDVSLS